jgi:electron transfer flavoprotein alpha subunit
LTQALFRRYARLVANVLCAIELADGKPSPLSRAALATARRIASRVGATVYAVLACGETPPYSRDDAIATLGRAGADKVVLVTAAALQGPRLFATYGPAILAACERYPPALLLFPATVGAEDIAPRVAARLGAAFVFAPRIDIDAEQLVLSRPAFSGWDRQLAIEDLERPVVLVHDGAVRSERGEDDPEVLPLAAPPLKPAIVELGPGDADSPPSVLIRVARAQVPSPLLQRLRRFRAGVVTAGEADSASLDPLVTVAIAEEATDPVFRGAQLGLVGEPIAVLEQLAHAFEAELPTADRR